MKLNRPPVYFFHIPKTAGSSLSKIIRSAYPIELVMPAYEVPDLLKISRDEINKYRCFTGHFGTGLFSLLDHTIPCITMLRDPFERAVSAIHFARKIFLSSGIPELSEERKKFLIEKGIVGPKEIPLFNQQMEQLLMKGDLREMVHNRWFSRVIENQQTLYLGYDVDLSPTSDSPDSMQHWSRQTVSSLEFFFVDKLMCGFDTNKIVENAKKRLDEMKVVGIVEQFDDSTRLICDMLEFKNPKKIPMENVSSEKLSLLASTYRASGEIPTDVIKRIDELTVIDREIYEYGKNLFTKQFKNRKRRFFRFPYSSPK
jgi:hypothetical protein